MTAFTTVSSPVVRLLVDDIDTDQIIPARFLKVTDKKGLGENLFADWRKRPDFPLNAPEAKGAAILLSSNNFGCGSSREHAPWSLADYGFRAIIAPSFADIFANNCLKNGLLPLTLDDAEVSELMRRANQIEDYRVTVDLEGKTVSDAHGFAAAFEIDDFQRYCLLEGLDDIGLTLKHESEITRYEQDRPSWTATSRV